MRDGARVALVLAGLAAGLGLLWGGHATWGFALLLGNALFARRALDALATPEPPAEGDRTQL